MKRTGAGILTIAVIIGAAVGFILDTLLTAMGRPTFSPAASLPTILALLGVVGATQRSASPLADAKVLRAHYDLLVKRLARLDDLRAAEAITPDAHRAAREELSTRLGALAMRMREMDTAAHGAGTTAGDAAPAAGTATATSGAPKHTRA